MSLLRCQVLSTSEVRFSLPTRQRFIEPARHELWSALRLRQRQMHWPWRLLLRLREAACRELNMARLLPNRFCPFGFSPFYLNTSNKFTCRVSKSACLRWQSEPQNQDLGSYISRFGGMYMNFASRAGLARAKPMARSHDQK